MVYTMGFNVNKKDNIKLKICILFYICASILKANLSRMKLINIAIKNWPKFYLVYLGIKKSATLEFVDGYKINVSEDNLSKALIIAEFHAMLRRARDLGLTIRVNKEKVVVKIKKRWLILDRETAPSIITELLFPQHNVFDVKDRDIIDIGAYVGDTSIYYYLYGKARHVYAFEPIPYIYEKGLQIIKWNNLMESISFFNEGVSGEKGTTRILESKTNFDKVGVNKSNTEGRLIKIVSLDEFVKKYNIHSAFLKVDCEGCEYSIFQKISKETLQRFIGIHIEYHYGYLDLIKRLKEEGFGIIYTKPVYNFKGIGKKPMISGDIIAFRKKSILNLNSINKIRNKVIL